MSHWDKIIKGESFPRPINNRIPDFAFSQANITGNLYNPAIDKMRIDQKCEKPKWPDNKPYAVCITHDVDVISLQSKKENFRRMKLIFNSPAGGVFDYWHFMKHEFDHAGFVETSIMLAISDKVKMKRAKKGLITKGLSEKKIQRIKKLSTERGGFPKVVKDRKSVV